MELDNTLRGQINVRNDELQKVLNNTHAMLIENSGLVEQLNHGVMKGGAEMSSKRINFMKDEGKKEADDNFARLLGQQERENRAQIAKTQETLEQLLRKKEEEIKKASQDFKEFHDKIK